MQQNLDSVFRDNHLDYFHKIAEYLMAAENRYVIGMRGCKGIAVEFGRLLSFMLPGVHTVIDAECTSINMLQDAKPGDALVMFVFSRFYKIDEKYLEMAKKRDVRICLVTNDVTGPLCKFADIVLMAATENTSFFHSTIAVEMISEYLLSLVSSRADYRERIRERDEVTQSQRM